MARAFQVTVDALDPIAPSGFSDRGATRRGPLPDGGLLEAFAPGVTDA